MVTVYNAENSLEAHMIAGLLRQSGIRAEVGGEYLQGGVGELQAFGLARVLVEERDLDRAREVIEQWRRGEMAGMAESADSAPASGIDSDAHESTSNRSAPGLHAAVFSALGGLVVGVLITTAFLRLPISVDGMDHDGDGNLDERWHYAGDYLYKVTRDLNLDGKVDEVTTFGTDGAESFRKDADFDGRFETRGGFRWGIVSWQRSDWDDDGVVDQSITYTKDGTATLTFFDAATRRPIRVQSLDAFGLKWQQVDTDNDGILDTMLEYDRYENLIKTSRF